MKRITTNDAHCSLCYYFRVPESGELFIEDGFCTKKTRPCGKYVCWNNYCDEWEHKETRITHFEVMTKTPEPKRTEAEAEYIMQLLGKDRSEE